MEYHEEGHNIREPAKIFGISPNTLNAWLKQYRDNGGLERKYRSYKTGYKRRRTASASKSLFKISISRLFGLSSATLCQRSLRIFFEYAAFAFPCLAKTHHKKIR
ncbi:MAG: helix-turn-helix domain-containing protein [Clostridiales bacterium]|nr:helix-turn-helix domain-containing protein [Clostridiales bacterium]